MVLFYNLSDGGDDNINEAGAMNAKTSSAGAGHIRKEERETGYKVTRSERGGDGVLSWVPKSAVAAL